jgi:hypothetical protein
MSCFVTASCPFLAARWSGAHYLLVLVGGGHGAAGVGDTVVIVAHEVGTGRGLLVEFVHRAESYKTVETRDAQVTSYNKRVTSYNKRVKSYKRSQL